jgi:hypothetical protein
VVCLLLAQLLNAARGALGQRAISCASGMRRWNSTSRGRHHSDALSACPQRHDVEQRLAAQHVLQYAHADTDAAAAEARQRSRQQAICTPAWAQHQAQPSVSYLFDASTLQGRCSLAHRQQKGCGRLWTAARPLLHACPRRAAPQQRRSEEDPNRPVVAILLRVCLLARVCT